LAGDILFFKHNWELIILSETGMGRNKGKKWQMRWERAFVEIDRVEAEEPESLRS
jgi:predicted alpha/beta hydrolase family esterase